MKAAIFQTETGQIVTVVTGPESFCAAQCKTGQGWIDVGDESGTGHYVADGALVEFPEQPSRKHTFDYTTKQWIDPRTLQDLKDAKWKEIKAARSTAEYGGFTWDVSTFDSDQISQGRITGAVTLAQMNSAFTIGWTLADNTVRTLSAADMILVGQALGMHVAAQFATGQALRVQIEAAATAEEVSAIVW